MPEMRIERDTMGEMPVPAGAMYGAQTARAVQNFPISGMRLQRPFIRALGLVKACATRVNGANGWIDAAKETSYSSMRWYVRRASSKKSRLLMRKIPCTTVWSGSARVPA